MGDWNFYIELTRTSNDTSETGNAGTFKAYRDDYEYDLDMTLWDFDPTAESEEA